MKKLFLSILASLFTLFSFSQTIKLTQAKSKDDLLIVNNNYTIYLKESDIISAISKIDAACKTDNSALVASLKENKIKTINMNAPAASEQAFADLVKTNLGAYLLYQGKASVYAGTKQITKIVADESPEIVDLDGSSKTTTAFSEEGKDDTLFVGDMNSKLKNQE